MSKTFAMIKPDAVRNDVTGRIIEIVESNGFEILGMDKILLTRLVVCDFYREHQGKSFFGPLVDFMSSGPLIVLALEHPDAVPLWRVLMGATDPKKAAFGTIREMWGTEMPRNAVHGSDSAASAEHEIALFKSLLCPLWDHIELP